MTITYSPDQLATTELIDGLEPGGRLLVKAEGGCGKTFTIGTHLSRKTDATIALVSPTHTALDKLYEDFVSHFPDATELARISRFTSARFAGRFLNEQIETGALNNAWHMNGFYTKEFDYVVVDEVSMIPRADLLRILRSGCRIIFMGDDAQSKPVREKTSPIFESDFRDEHDIQLAELHKNHRQNDDLKAISQKCRRLAHYPESSSDYNTVHESADALVSVFFEFALANHCRNNFAYMAFTNREVARVRDQLRTLWFDETKDDWHQGEQIRISQHPDLRNGQVVEVAKTEGFIQREVHGFTFTIQKLLVLDAKGNQHYCEMLRPFDNVRLAEAQSYFQKLGDVAKDAGDNAQAKANWEKRSEFNRQFDQGEMACVITVLKSQGRTIEHVFCNTDDIHRFGTSKKHLLYVAYSRTATHLHTVERPGLKASAFRGRCKELGIKQLSDSQYAKLIREYSEERHVQYWLMRKGNKSLSHEDVRHQLSAMGL